jgi:hypothetical protein
MLALSKATFAIRTDSGGNGLYQMSAMRPKWAIIGSHPYPGWGSPGTMEVKKSGGIDRDAPPV